MRAESGGRLWIMNYKLRDYHFDTKEQAVAFVEGLPKRRDGKPPIADVGCMHWNFFWHPTEKSVAETFDPAINIEWAALHLTDLHRKSGGD